MKTKAIDIKVCEQMLAETRKIIRHQKEKEKLRGEKFNVFSILKMEHRENDTHSAFLAELLNPDGSHLCGTLFLDLFLQTVAEDSTELHRSSLPTLDSASTQVKTEHSIGRRNDTDKTGGRIDIYLLDKNNTSICIENKIYARDQYAQIERYCQHNKGKNKVYYLTLWGSKPSIESCGTLKEDDYRIISYKKHIIEWLTLCMKEAHNLPILRETIKQYTLLIKKLTHTMNNEEEKELFHLILKNYDEALYLVENVNKALSNLKGRIREAVYKQLVQKLDDHYLVYKGAKIESPYSQIWIKLKGKEEQKLFFGIQSFAVKKDDFFSQLFIGIFVYDGAYNDRYKSLGEKRSNWWVADNNFEDFKGFKVDLCNSTTLKKLDSDVSFYNDFIDHIVDQSIAYIKIHHDALASFLLDA